MTANPLTDNSKWTVSGPPGLTAADVWIDHDGQARPLTERGRDAIATAEGLPVLRYRRPHWHLSIPPILIPERPEGGRHRADTIGRPAFTIADVERWRAYIDNVRRTRYRGHLGTRGRHECRCRRCAFDRAFANVAAAAESFRTITTPGGDW
ncbi:hypothetical protein [Mycobacterium phage Weirdo19]|uniref:Uncharacterized protein n=1 Tax=Mycobacterium phage Weirdo19 TaxID=2601610 RepID=A0A6M2YST9_9CAUD|nr:hypothetical protein KDJ11_gp80 [Mycobacterium phage Weirdo19]QEA10848.1 hypothetical protein [Mycobacterium phage Weirdo19]